MLKDRIIDGIISKEGGYVNTPNDSGGATNFGITEKVARAYGFTGDMKDLPRSIAVEIYTEKYWNSVCGDALLALSECVCEEIVDTAVNMGPRTAGTYLQRCLNVLIDDGLLVDGWIGKQTIYALKRYLAKRDEQTLLKALNSLQGERYISLAENRPKDRAFVYGWLKNRVEI